MRELRLRALADTPIAYLETLEDAERRPEAFWRERIRGHGSGQSVQTVAVADDGTWVGSMVVLITQGPPAYAGGVTDALLADLDDWVRGRGLSELYLHVAEDNLRARAAYVKRGFVETGERIRIPGDRDVDEIEMVATLPLEGERPTGTDTGGVFIALRSVADGVVATELDDEATHPRMSVVRLADLPGWVAEREPEKPRWVWDDTTTWYPDLLRAGTRVERALDLRLCRRILRHSVSTAGTDLATAPADEWDAPAPERTAPDALFDLEPASAAPDPVAELRRQRTAVAAAPVPGKLNLLLAAESVGALAAVEMQHAGLPWDAARHEAILTELLGPRPMPGARPARMEAVLADVRRLLDDPELNPDSPAELLKGLQRAGLQVASTRSWELKGVEHPAMDPLLEYKKLARLLSANGWNWLDQWVRDGRFRPSYVPGGVVTGRWASDGGGALQLPKQVRGAVVADPGWTFVVADAAQLEPRVLAAISGDAAMARAGRATDMYQGMVDSGAVETRSQAKYGMLGAIYGGTTGESGRMRPRIERAFPVAMAYVEAAARAGEAGQVVSTWLGRSSPRGAHAAYGEGTTEAEARRTRNQAAAWGRFTRNFVVQGTAAEWALSWIGALRRRLWNLGPEDAPLVERPHLVFFLHDELIVHTPVEFAPQVAESLRAAAADAGRLLFGSAPVEFALSVSIVQNYADAR